MTLSLLLALLEGLVLEGLAGFPLGSLLVLHLLSFFLLLLLLLRQRLNVSLLALEKVAFLSNLARVALDEALFASDINTPYSKVALITHKDREGGRESGGKKWIP